MANIFRTNPRQRFKRAIRTIADQRSRETAWDYIAAVVLGGIGVCLIIWLYAGGVDAPCC